MEFLAHEVLIEAISKLAALSNSKLFLLLEDSQSNRSYAGSESLCAAFVEGGLSRRDQDARVDYDVSERRFIKSSSRHVARKTTRDDHVAGNRSRDVGALAQDQPRDGEGRLRDDDDDVDPRQRRTTTSEGREASLRKRAGDPGNREVEGKRVKSETDLIPVDDDAESASSSNATSHPLASIESALRDDNLMSTISSALKSLSHLPSSLPSSSSAASSSTAPVPPVSTPDLFAAPREMVAPRDNGTSTSSRYKESRSRSPRAGVGGSGGTAMDSIPNIDDRRNIDNPLPPSSSVSLFPPDSAAPSSSSNHRRSASSSPSRASPSSSQSSSSAYSAFSGSATRTIRLKCADDAESLATRFGRFGTVLDVARDRSISAVSSKWWTIEFDTVRAAAEALRYAAETRRMEASFDANTEYTDWMWIAFTSSEVAAAAKTDPSSMDRVAATFLRGQFAIFGKILRTSSVKYSEEFTEASCVMQFRTSKHVEMIIQKVRGQQLNGIRFQLDVASPLLKDKYFATSASGVVGSGPSREPSSGESIHRNQPQRQYSPAPRRRDAQEAERDAEDAFSTASSSRTSHGAAAPEREPLSHQPRQPPPAQQPTPREEEKSRTIRLVLSEKQLSILQQCPLEKLVALFSSYGPVVEVYMPSESHPDFAVEFVDVESAEKAVVAGQASSVAFKSVYELAASGASTADSVWLGGLDMPPVSSGFTASAIRRQLLDKFADIEPQPRSIWIARSKSQAVIRFSSPEVAQRVLAALREERRTEKSRKKREFDAISAKAVRIFVEKMSPEDKKENEKSK